MLILNCSKSAAEFFSRTKAGKKITVVEKVKEKTLSPSEVKANTPQQMHWMLHTIKVKAKNVTIAMEYQTRFSITLAGVKKGEDGVFLDMLEHHLIVHVHELMGMVGASSQAIQDSLDCYRAQHDTRSFCLRSDRSVQAHINDVAWHFRQLSSEIGAVPTGVDLVSQDVYANQIFRKRRNEKDYFEPRHEFLHYWLTSYADYTNETAEQCIEDIKARMRAAYAQEYPELSKMGTSSTEPKPLANQDTDFDRSMDNVVYLDAYRKK